MITLKTCAARGATDARAVRNGMTRRTDGGNGGHHLAELELVQDLHGWGQAGAGRDESQVDTIERRGREARVFGSSAVMARKHAAY